MGKQLLTHAQLTSCLHSCRTARHVLAARCGMLHAVKYCVLHVRLPILLQCTFAIQALQ